MSDFTEFANNVISEDLACGEWLTNEAGLPCFDLRIQDDQNPDAAFRHLISTGHLSAMADRFGNANLFTTEGGFIWINSPESTFARASLYMMMEVEGELVSLLYSELSKREKIRFGTGYIEYHGEIRIRGARVRVVQRIFAPPNRKRVIHGCFSLANLSSKPLKAALHIHSDVTSAAVNAVFSHPQTNSLFTSEPGLALFADINEQLGSVFLKSSQEWIPSARRITLRLSRDVEISAGDEFTVDCAIGYGIGEQNDVNHYTSEKAQNQWNQKLAPFAVDAHEEWMRRECVWNAGQLLSFTSYDSSVGEYYASLGGYGWEGFSVREVSETSMVLAACDWELAASSLRFVAKTQLASGDVCKIHTMRRDRSVTEFDSDNEIWFVLGCCESIAITGQTGFLDEVCSYWDSGEGTIWEHIKRAFYWVRDEIGRGIHGLILIREGDWNDYLSLMGAKGRGESVMNSGMACRAFDKVALIARQRSEEDFAAEVEGYVAELRLAVAASFDQGWFVRGYNDQGKAVGSYAEDRLFINAQSWTVLGKCGTPGQRISALQNALRKCHTDIGLTLMSRPYSSPAPDDISWCAIPAGEGENAGIWPQTIHWMVWALAEEGMKEEALREWKCGTLHSHARHFPQVPFGIFNGPDCFSSKWAGKREGWTQLQLLDRSRFVPMNPMVAWQGFTLQKINDIGKKTNFSLPESREVTLPNHTNNGACNRI